MSAGVLFPANSEWEGFSSQPTVSEPYSQVIQAPKARKGPKGILSSRDITPARSARESAVESARIAAMKTEPGIPCQATNAPSAAASSRLPDRYAPLLSSNQS